MTTSVIDPRLENYKTQIEAAFSGAPGPNGKGFQTDGARVHDASTVAGALLSAYHTAAIVNPAKAFRPKAFTPQAELSDPSVLYDKGWFDSVLNIVQDLGPVVINALSKDYAPPQPTLSQVIQQMPEARRKDPEWIDYATTLLLSLGQNAIQAMSGAKDFTKPDTEIGIPQPPPGKDKGWFDDAIGFVERAAPVVLPIVMSAL
jgi:hypothetical protein